MTLIGLVLRGLRYHWRVHTTVALGVAAATAVLTGALLVGDSVRGSLRHLTLDRLGKIDEVLVAGRFFRARLASELESEPTFSDHYCHAVPVMFFSGGTVEHRTEAGILRAAKVNVLGSQAEQTEGEPAAIFWDLGAPNSRPCTIPGLGQIVLNQRLADEVHAHIGDDVTVRLPKAEGIPADSALGDKEDRIRSLPRLRVVDIVPAEGLGAFQIRGSQQTPRNAYVALQTVQLALKQPGKVNAIFVSGRTVDHPPGDAASSALASVLHPTLEDLGVVLSHPKLIYPSGDADEREVIYDYFSISSQRMILPPEVERAAERALGDRGGQPVFTYLANAIQKCSADGQTLGHAIPYSMVTAIDFTDQFPLVATHGKRIAPLPDDGIVLTSWAAEDLSASVGDHVELTFFEPETRQGRSVERSTRFRVTAITPLTRPTAPYFPSRKLRFDQRPTLANDPLLTPEVAGITDQRSIDDWEVPFTINYRRIRPKDDAYWATYSTTPKAYVALRTGRRLWASRFGNATAYRVPEGDDLDESALRAQLRRQLAADRHRLGFEFMPVKRRQLAASSGNTPFDVLFLMLSFFVIVAALMLVVLLFRLGFQQRASQAGLLLAVGWPERRVGRVFGAEGLFVSAAGGLFGVGFGIGYARLILAALSSKSWWLGAIATPFLQFHGSARSLAIGYVSGVIASTLMIAWSVRQTRHIPASRLLAGQLAAGDTADAVGTRWSKIAVILLAALAFGLIVLGQRLSGQAEAGAFVGAGACVLGAILVKRWRMFHRRAAKRNIFTRSWPLARLAAQTAARNPLRSTLTIGLIATASFLIVAISAFQLHPTESGTGGCSLVAESSQPIFYDLNRQADRVDLLGDRASVLSGTRVLSFRVRDGDDASCGNLYQATQPRVLGVPASLIDYYNQPGRHPFDWAGSAATTGAGRENPWILLRHGARDDQPIPVVIDHDTAVYSLHLYHGIGETFVVTYQQRPITFRVVGLLSISVLHGNLLIGESDFRKLFPTVSGYRYFLIDAPVIAKDRVTRVLEDSLGDQGMDVTGSRQILIGLLAIQNTYLRTFQSLGALGLLLGTFGLAVVQWRSVLERRGEMGLLRAAGFRRIRLFQLVLMENIALLFDGLAIGALAAALALMPRLGHSAEIPFAQVGIMLGVVLAVGGLAGSVAAWATLRVPLLDALSQER